MVTLRVLKKREQEVNKYSSQQCPFQRPHPFPGPAKRGDTRSFLSHTAQPRFEFPPLLLEEEEVGVSWEKGNHSLDELLKGKFGQASSLSGILAAATEKISVLPQHGSLSGITGCREPISRCVQDEPAVPWIMPFHEEHGLLLFLLLLSFCSAGRCGCPLQHADLTFLFLFTSQVVFQECRSAIH